MSAIVTPTGLSTHFLVYAYKQYISSTLFVRVASDILAAVTVGLFIGRFYRAISPVVLEAMHNVWVRSYDCVLLICDPSRVFNHSTRLFS